MSNGRAASVHARLLARAKQRAEDFNLLLTRYALERFLYRLSISPSRNGYLLKGALLFDFWFDFPHRPTRDADLLGFGLLQPCRGETTSACEATRGMAEEDMAQRTNARSPLERSSLRNPIYSAPIAA